ncbi:MAG: cupin domain-containing protein [Rhodoplanes sp.]|uniref:cupin domain-containing protein n=1 Tax=Rhodoplanes sp. TaxID=1968906 RepID=UPI0017C57991|nr:cupin domain-containing protein [Rhodoplanes sp.]NVO15729.1 cupin domain-containing protein [Rhodoplanes sp.]
MTVTGRASPLCVRLSDIPETVLVPAKYLSGGSIGAQIAYGSDMSLLVATRQPGYHSRPHTHDAEQLNYVLQGELYVFVGDDGFLARKGDVFRVPRNAVHWSLVKGTGPCVLLETHAPPLVGDPGVVDTAVALVEDGAALSVTAIGSEWPSTHDTASVEERVLARDRAAAGSEVLS